MQMHELPDPSYKIIRFQHNQFVVVMMIKKVIFVFFFFTWFSNTYGGYEVIVSI